MGNLPVEINVEPLPVFSLDQLAMPAPFSAIFSLLLLVGFDGIGVILLRVLGIGAISFRQWPRWQTVVLSATVFEVLLYPLALMNLTPRVFIQGIALACILFGMLKSFGALHRSLLRNKAISIHVVNVIGAIRAPDYLLLALIIGFGLIAFGPVTSADSLDYHIGISIALLNQGGMPFVPEWFSGRLAGNGEVLNALGLAVGAEQFGSLLQFGGLLGIFGLLYCSENTSSNTSELTSMRANSIISLAALSAPVLLFLVSSSKPQLLPVAMTSLAFALVMYPSRRQLPPAEALASFTLVCLLVMAASQTKLTYMLGGGGRRLACLGRNGSAAIAVAREWCWAFGCFNCVGTSCAMEALLFWS
jgi:hypothetical protein